MFLFLSLFISPIDCMFDQYTQYIFTSSTIQIINYYITCIVPSSVSYEQVKADDTQETAIQNRIVQSAKES